MAGGDVQKIAFRLVCTHFLGMAPSILRFSHVFNKRYALGTYGYKSYGRDGTTGPQIESTGLFVPWFCISSGKLCARVFIHVFVSFVHDDMQACLLTLLLRDDFPQAWKYLRGIIPLNS